MSDQHNLVKVKGGGMEQVPPEQADKDENYREGIVHIE